MVISNDNSNTTKQRRYTIQIKFKKRAAVRLLEPNILSSLSDSDVSPVESIINKYNVELKRSFNESEEEMISQMDSTRSSAPETPDLSRYYTTHTNNEKSAKDLVMELSSQETVESVQIVPVGTDATSNTSTPDFLNRQGYLDQSPGGVDAFYAWKYPGGKGDGIRIIDVEQSWNFDHEDLKQNQSRLAGGFAIPSPPSRNHGTAVLGVIGGDENNFGIVGIAPNCQQMAFSVWESKQAYNTEDYGFHKAMRNAANLLSSGDIILIEQHAAGPDASGASQDGYIAMEYWDINFEAIKYATAKGIIVVEAAGNGSRDLDAEVFESKFDRSTRDSGAIVVGAGAPPSGNHGPDRSRLDFSNWGSIVDSQGWGEGVTTTGGYFDGGGDLQGGNENQWYTQRFNGTSSASPVVVGVIACLQGMRNAKGEAPLTFTQIRNLLRSTGSPQQDANGRPKSQRIGNRPNLREMLHALWPNIGEK